MKEQDGWKLYFLILISIQDPHLASACLTNGWVVSRTLQQVKSLHQELCNVSNNDQALLLSLCPSLALPLTLSLSPSLALPLTPSLSPSLALPLTPSSLPPYLFCLSPASPVSLLPLPYTPKYVPKYITKYITKYIPHTVWYVLTSHVKHDYFSPAVLSMH